MSCPYYWWNHNYACRKTNKDVNEDTYYKYCRNYNYSACPIYKQELPSDRSCFITTACIRAKNLPDDCEELTLLRKYRDSYLLSFDEGKSDVAHYYSIAPKIVSEIQKTKNSNDIFVQLYYELIVPCVELIQKQKYKEAHELYKNTTMMLESKYL